MCILQTQPTVGAQDPLYMGAKISCQENVMLVYYFREFWPFSSKGGFQESHRSPLRVPEFCLQHFYLE